MVVELNYNLNVLNKIFKQDFYKIFIIFVIFFAFVLLSIFMSPIEITAFSLYFILGILFGNNFLGILWMLFQCLMTIYFSYLFCFYEANNSPEFIFLREKFTSFILKKYFILEVVIVLFRILFYILLYPFFVRYHIFNLFSFFMNIAIHFIISSAVYLPLVFFKNIKNLGD